MYLTNEIAMGALDKVINLYLEYNQIGDAGISSLADAVSKGALPALNTLYIVGNPASAATQKAARDTIQIKGHRNIQMWIGISRL